MPAPQALPPGTEVAHYRLGKELGRGGFAMVYVAMDQNTGGSVAVKHLEVASMDKDEQEFLQVRCVSLSCEPLKLLRQLCCAIHIFVTPACCRPKSS